MLNNSELNYRVINNFKHVRLQSLIAPVFILLSISFYFMIICKGNNFTSEYVNTQKDLFFTINCELSQFPKIEFNLTQLGDAFIFFPFITIFFIYAPKLWKALLTSSIISLIVSACLKRLFAVPRPAAMLDHDNFVIIGKTLSGATSLPSGHSISIFIVITTLLYAFMPTRLIYKFFWYVFFISTGLFIAFSRVGVGAHYPLDVIIGCTIGYVLGVIGIIINNKVNWLSCINNKKFYPILMLLFVVWFFILLQKVTANNSLVIYYFSMISLAITLYLMTNVYVKKKN